MLWILGGLEFERSRTHGSLATQRALQGKNWQCRKGPESVSGRQFDFSVNVVRSQGVLSWWVA